jgi:transcriptional regulator with XRE-family HTH domain
MTKARKDEEKLRKVVGAAVARRRKIVGIGVEALARAAGVDTSQMVKVLRGDCGLSVYSLARVATVLQCSCGDLVPGGVHGPSASTVRLGAKRPGTVLNEREAKPIAPHNSTDEG